MAEARNAAGAGADGLIAKGSESGGRIGDTSAFVLLQQLLADTSLDLPVWSAGGIGLHTAAAVIAGGAAGVVLDAQLALAAEAELSNDAAAAVGSMDGSETTVIDGHRVYTRPDLPVATEDQTIVPVATRLGGQNLRTQLLPVGQDGAFAHPLADQYVTAGGIVAAVRKSIAEPPDRSRRHPATGRRLAPGRRPGLDLPGGPGSDDPGQRPGHVRVGSGGGRVGCRSWPCRSCRPRGSGAAGERHRRLLGAMTWGVGILGFVPAELRATQLAVVHDVRPPCALIAGGRPSQAAPLEAAGIDTFLHVPSPGLLDRFLREGARKFVFEGRECGGHVGPRSSFALWEAQIGGCWRSGPGPTSRTSPICTSCLRAVSTTSGRPP